MKEIHIKLKCHTPWCKYVYPEYSQLSLEELEQKLLNDIHTFHCDKICDLRFTNWGEITISFHEEKNLTEVREMSAILLYFISICNGFNCEYAPDAIIDGNVYKDFFSFAPEDKTRFPLLKSIKFYDVSLQEIKDSFSNILCDLFAPNKRPYYLALLSNYYSLMVYKDFIGNGEYKFRNIITDLESLITIMNYDKTYKALEEQNKSYFKQVKKHLLNPECKGCSKLNSSYNFNSNETSAKIMAKGVSLEYKLKDMFDYIKAFGLSFKLDLSRECTKMAYTRNFISHLFEPNENILSSDEMSNYTAIFEILFRMIFLSYCGIDNSLIKKNFLRNEPIRQTLNDVFNLD